MTSNCSVAGRFRLAGVGTVLALFPLFLFAPLPSCKTRSFNKSAANALGDRRGSAEHVIFLNPQGGFTFQTGGNWPKHPDFGGQIVYVREVAEAMARGGAKVDIVTRLYQGEPVLSEASSKGQGVEVHPELPNLRIVRIMAGKFAFLAKERLWSVLGDQWVDNIAAFYVKEGAKPTAITSHYGDGGFAGVLLKEKWGVPLTFTGHSLGAQKMDALGASSANLESLDAQYNFKERILAERVSMSWADFVVTSTIQERIEQYGHKAYRAPGPAGTSAFDPVKDVGRYVVIPPGVNTRVFKLEGDSAEDKRIEDLIKESLARDVESGRRALPWVLAASRLERKKNHIGLIRAFAESQELQKRANLAIMIQGVDEPFKDSASYAKEERELVEALVKAINEGGLRGKVVTLNLRNQSDIAAAYRATARAKGVFALTASYEPFGLAPLEAAASGVPVVVTNKGGPCESFQEPSCLDTSATSPKRYGVLVNPDDPSEIARGLLEPLSSPEAWRTFSQAGLDRVRTTYTWQSTADRYLGAIRSARSRPFAQGREPIPEALRSPRSAQPLPLQALRNIYFAPAAP